MKREFFEAVRSAVSFILLIWGTVFAGLTALIAYMAWAGTVPVWHPLVAALVSMATLAASYLMS